MSACYFDDNGECVWTDPVKRILADIVEYPSNAESGDVAECCDVPGWLSPSVVADISLWTVR